MTPRPALTAAVRARPSVRAAIPEDLAALRAPQYALARRAEDELSLPEIRPVILEGPPIVEPWDELADLHFNDRLLYFMRPSQPH